MNSITSPQASENTAIIDRARRQSLGDILKRSASRYPGVSAIECGAHIRWTYAEFDALCDALAEGLLAEGLSKGDRIAVLARNSHSFALLRFALARAGGVLVPINFMLNADEVAYILEHSGARTLCMDAEFADTGRTAAAHVGGDFRFWGLEDETAVSPEGVPSLNELASASAPGSALDAVQLGGDDLAQIIYTSGTESKPKGALLKHDSVIWEYVTCLVDTAIEAGDVMLHALPLYHCAQLDVFLGPSIYVGGTNIITAAPTPDNIIEKISSRGITSFFAPPTVWIAILRDPQATAEALASLRKGYYGASIMPVEVLKELIERFPELRLWNLYGQTEIAPVATVLQPEEQLAKAGSAGRPALNVETRVVDDAGHDVAVGEIGEVVHRSPQLLSGYFNDPERTAEAFVGGWFHSGDLATRDDDGYITIVDRKKDMIKSGGENVSSREVEEVIYQLGEVSEVAVVGVPDEKWIEAVCAVVVLKDGETLDEQQLISHCADALAGFKTPKRVAFVDALPKNPSGKVLKRELREKVQG
ncbi:MAG: acyl-CoA synthetase [Pseudomonadota bacterium]